jgi:hypothetical protein
MLVSPVVISVQEFHASLDKALKEKASQAPVVVPHRLPSPSPSASSSNSSLSTISNRTAVPLAGPSKLSQRHRSGSSTSVTSDVTVTKSPSRPNPRSTPRGSPRASVVRGLQNSAVATTGQSPGTLALIRESLRAYLTTNRLTTLTILFLLLPLVSYIIRRRRARAAAAPALASTADQVKRRLFDTRGGSILHKLWSEVGSVIWDTVRMGGWRLGINVGFWINYLSYLYSNRFDYRFLGFCIPDIYLLHGCHVTNTGKKNTI